MALDLPNNLKVISTFDDGRYWVMISDQKYERKVKGFVELKNGDEKLRQNKSRG